MIFIKIFYKSRDEKSSLFAVYKICANQLLKLLLPSFLLEEKRVQNQKGAEIRSFYENIKFVQNQ